MGSVFCAPMAFPVVFGHTNPFDLQKARGAVVRPIASTLPVRHPQLSTFRSRQNSTARPKHNHRPLRCADSNATCSSGRVQDASPDFLLNQYLHPSGPPSAWLCARRACGRACVRAGGRARAACVSEPSVHRPRRPRCVGLCARPPTSAELCFRCTEGARFRSAVPLVAGGWAQLRRRTACRPSSSPPPIRSRAPSAHPTPRSGFTNDPPFPPSCALARPPRCSVRRDPAWRTPP